jgi:hypothetical protein
MQGLFMDKIKVAKGLVFVLTFGIVFLLCCLVIQIGRKQTNEPYRVELNVSGRKARTVAATDKYLIVSDKNLLSVFDLETGRLKGNIVLRSVNHGKEK